MSLLGNGWDDPNSSAIMALAEGLMQGNPGAGIGGANRAYASSKKAALDAQMQKMQMDNYASEIDARKLAGVKDARQQALIESFFPGMNGSGGPQAGPSSPGAYQVPSNGMGPALPQPSAPQGGNDILALSQKLGIPPQAIQADMVFNGGKKISEMLDKHGSRDMQVTNGYAYDKNNVGAGFMPSLSVSKDGQTSMTRIGSDGMPVISAPQGAVDTFDQYNRKSAEVKPIKVYNPVTQREEYSNEAAVARGQPSQSRTGNSMTDAVMQTESGGNPNAVSPKGARGLMQVLDGTNAAPGFGVAPARDESAGERTRVGQDYLAKMQERYKDPALAAIAYNWGPGNTDMWLKSGGDYKKLPAETQSYVSQVMTRNGVNSFAPQSGNFAAGPSVNEKSAAKFGEDMAAKQAEMIDKSVTSAKTAADDLMGIRESRKAIAGGVFIGSGAETKLSIAKFVNANIPGVTIEADKVGNTDYLKSTLGRGLLEQAKTLGSNPSNADANRINDIVGSIGKDPNAMTKILDWRQEMAQRSISQHNTRVDQAEASGFKSQFDLRVKSPVEQSAQAEPKTKPALLDTLPKTAPKGQRVRDTATGKILQFNGLSWAEEK